MVPEDLKVKGKCNYIESISFAWFKRTNGTMRTLNLSYNY